MADQRVVENTDKSPGEAGTQVRDKAQEVGTQVRDKAQEAARHVADTASAYYQQGREQVAVVEHSLEDSIRAKPLQSVFIAAGLGMLMAFLVRK